MQPAQIIRIKRDGAALSPVQIGAFVQGLVDGSWSDSQAAALAMAIVWRGMDAAETVALTNAMAHSGSVLDWRAEGFDGPVLDKHSTGGVGDKVSLILAPLLAECGAAAGAIVPMVSGRGLGHTGGTLDKLEALPGYTVEPPHEQLVATLRSVGCAIVGASASVAPADRRLYAIRDITATVESVPLVTASILSKKLAAGLASPPSALVLDVKVGGGAFMRTLPEALALARCLVDVARGAGLPARALLTDMDRVLGHAAGNALEVREAIHFLTGRAREPRLLELTLALAAEVLQLGGVVREASDGRRLAERALTSGAAAERFARMVAALGGPRDVLHADGLATAPVLLEVRSPCAGTVSGIDVQALGLAVVALGGGRRRAGDRIDSRVGIARVAAPGQHLAAGEPLAIVHAADAAAAEAARAAVAAAFAFDGEAASSERPIILERVDATTPAARQSGP